MKVEQYFYNCSKEFIHSIDTELYNEVIDTLTQLTKRATQSEINYDIFLSLVSKGWAYDTLPPKNMEHGENIIRHDDNKRFLCETSTTLDAKWHSDFAKSYTMGIIQIESQFGTVESMFKDFCGFRIAYYERRLALGIEIVLCEPNKYFEHSGSCQASCR